MEAFDLAVRLWPVGVRAFAPDPERRVSVSPGVGLVCGAAVGEHTFDGDTAAREPGDSAFENADGGDSFLITADLGVGDAGVIIDDRVDERGAATRFVARLALPAPCCRALPVPVSLMPADVTPAAAVWDVAELGHIDMDRRSGVVVFATTDGFASDPVDMAEPVDLTARQDSVDGRGGHAELAADLHRAQPASPPSRHDPLHHLRRRLRWHRAWPTGRISHSSFAFSTVSGGPPAGRGR